jgi:hypothetical protein
VEQVILVDKEDCEIGVMEKMEAHKQPILHRAFSIFLFRRSKCCRVIFPTLLLTSVNRLKAFSKFKKSPSIKFL